jgi:hypothetical protein
MTNPHDVTVSKRWEGVEEDDSEPEDLPGRIHSTSGKWAVEECYSSAVFFLFILKL